MFCGGKDRYMILIKAMRIAIVQMPKVNDARFRA
jgi:hypothetical protein